MLIRFITLDEYVNQALERAANDRAAEGPFAERIPLFEGVVAFSPVMWENEGGLSFTLVDWIRARLKSGRQMPIVSSVDLNKKPGYESVEAM